MPRRSPTPMRFPLADWIDGHVECRYQFGSSGMAGVVRPPVPSARELRAATEDELRRRIGRLLGAAPARVFLAPGATEANSWVTWFVARRTLGRAPRLRVEYPEYPPLFDGPREVGYRVTTGTEGPVDLAVVSQPRNPEGDLWARERVAAYAEGASVLLVDETFREFSPAASTLRWGLPRHWVTGSFTKAYGGDDLRVGWVVAPDAARDEFARFHGLVANELARSSVAGALATLNARDRILRRVRALVQRNQRLWRAATPSAPALRGPVTFDRSVGPDGDAFARRCLRSSVLVSPGSFFGDPRGVRVGLTRPTFPSDLARYRKVRDSAPGAR